MTAFNNIMDDLNVLANDINKELKNQDTTIDKADE